MIDKKSHSWDDQSILQEHSKAMKKKSGGNLEKITLISQKVLKRLLAGSQRMTKNLPKVMSSLVFTMGPKRF